MPLPAGVLPAVAAGVTYAGADAMRASARASRLRRAALVSMAYAVRAAGSAPVPTPGTGVHVMLELAVEEGRPPSAAVAGTTAAPAARGTAARSGL